MESIKEFLFTKERHGKTANMVTCIQYDYLLKVRTPYAPMHMLHYLLRPLTYNNNNNNDDIGTWFVSGIYV
jgi:hypothetical protein